MSEIPSDFFAFLNICEIHDDAAIIYCEGLGTTSNQGVYTNPDAPNTFTYINIDYDTRGLIPDLFVLHQNIRVLKKYNDHQYQETLKNMKNMKNISRSKRLESIVDIIIQHKDKTQIILFGISHGSIILHLALLRLKTRSDFTDDLMKRIVFVTVGSPHPPPGMLMHKYENESIHYYNFYHKDDVVLKNFFVKWGLSNISRAINFFTLPLQSSKGQVVPYNYESFPINSSQPLIIFDATRRFCIIQHYIPFYINMNGINTHASPLLAYPFFFKQLYTNGEKYKLFMPTTVPLLTDAFTNFINKDYTTLDYNIYSKSLDYALRFSICDYGILSDLRGMKDAGNEGSAFISAAVPARNQGGGYKSLELKKTKQTYIVHTDKKLNKPYIRVSNRRVYLCDIRNRYRYIY
jgi:hypothetical protein